ncbi:MAG: MFS transporter [Acidobacteria bacterium]|nr:MFS transporter [Acidobacteriota bacterium]
MQRKWAIVGMLFLIAGLNYCDRTAISSVYPLLRSEFGLSDVVIAALGSAFLWSYGLGSPFAGRVADRVSRTRMLLISLVGWSVVMMLSSLANGPTALIVSRILLGIAECAYLPASIALISDHHGPESRGTAMAVQIAGMNAGMIGGSVVAGYLGERLGWRLDFLILGAAGLVLAAIAALVLRDGPRAKAPETEQRPSVFELFRIPAYVAVVGSAMMIAIGTWVFVNWLPLYIHDHFHVGLAIAGLSGTSVLQVAAVLGTLLGGVISDRLAKRSPAGRIMALAVAYFCAAPFLLAFLFDPSMTLVQASVFMYSFMRCTGSASECPIICEVVGDRLKSTGLGILNMMNTLAGGAGVMVAGLLKQHFGLAVTFAALSATVAAAGFLVLATATFMMRRSRVLTADREPAGVQAA